MKTAVISSILVALFFLSAPASFAQQTQRTEKERAEAEAMEEREEARRREAERAVAERERRLREERDRDLKLWLESVSPEGRARAEARENYYRALRLDGFQKDVEKFHRQAAELHALRFAPMSERWAKQDLERLSKDLEKATEKLLKFIDSGSDAPEIEVGPLPAERVETRLRRLAWTVNRLVPRIVQLTTGDVLDLELQRDVRVDLFVIRALSHELRN
jgi:hypothetical protein